MRRSLLLATLALLGPGGAPAFADLTAFVGATSTPVHRPARGVALGVSLLLVGFEVEYADTTEDAAEGAPALRTGMFNALAQTPVPIGGTQFYLTAGVGLYREHLAGSGRTHVGGNVGGGAKIDLVGPLRLRLDYRVFTLRGARAPRPQRIYAGLTLRF